MTDIHINIFNGIEDTRVNPLKVSWDNIITFFTSPHDIIDNKFDAKLFNLAHYKDVSSIPEYSEYWIMDPHTCISYTRRKQGNILENDALIIDYDDSISLNEAKERFKDYEYIYYTSYRHLHDGNTEKFRFIIPFTEPVPSWRNKDKYGNILSDGNWYRIIDALKEFTGPCDPKSFETNTIYNKPSCPQSRIELSSSGHHQGIKLDWRKLKTTPFTHHTHTPSSHVFSTNTHPEYLDPDTIIQTTSGPIKLSTITGKIEGVFCPSPFHDDQNGSEFARKAEHTGNIFIYCKKCDQKFYMRKEQPTKIKHQKTISKDYEKYLDSFFEPYDKKTYEYYDDREIVKKNLIDIKNIIDKDTGDTPKNSTYQNNNKIYKSHIIYMTEGSGKSRLALDMANSGQKIIFACKSWAQVELKYSEYLEAGLLGGFNIKVIRSKDAKARRRFNTKVIRAKQKYPYIAERILTEETIEEFIKNNPDLSPEFIRLSWNFVTVDDLSFSNIPFQNPIENGELYDDMVSPSLTDNNIRIILTTFEQLRILKLKKKVIPNDWLIWFDDPDIMDVVDIEPYDTKKWSELPEGDIETQTLLIDNNLYFKRNLNQSLGYSLRHHKCIYTTTEIITRLGIEKMMTKRKEQYITHNKMYNLNGGIITILGTHLVRKKYDGIIPLLARRLTKKKLPTLLIADGLSTEINHSNNKGRNDLSKTNLLVELSIPHPNQIRTISDALSFSFHTDRVDLSRSLTLDKLHQAIGRNSGYRWKGFQCVVLIDIQFHRYLVAETRYKIDSENSVLIDRTKSMSSKDTRTSDSVSPIVWETEHFLNNIHSYISDNRKVKPDITFVFNSIKELQKKLSYASRLVIALSNLSTIAIPQEFKEPTDLSHLQKKYWEIITWIFITHIPKKNIISLKQDILTTIRELNQ